MSYIYNIYNPKNISTLSHESLSLTFLSKLVLFTQPQVRRSNDSFAGSHPFGFDG